MGNAEWLVSPWFGPSRRATIQAQFAACAPQLGFFICSPSHDAVQSRGKLRHHADRGMPMELWGNGCAINLARQNPRKRCTRNRVATAEQKMSCQDASIALGWPRIRFKQRICFPWSPLILASFSRCQLPFLISLACRRIRIHFNFRGK
jgi:hypothetical protein